MQVTLDSSAARIPIYRDALPLASRQVRWPGASSVVPFTARRVDWRAEHSKSPYACGEKQSVMANIMGIANMW